MNNYEKHKFLKEKLNAPRFDNEDEEIDWYAKHLYGLYHQASRLREENNHYMSKIDKQKEVLDKIKERVNKVDFEMGDFPELDLAGDILELLEEIE